tara:strand:- start:176 stop:631 length:456 start_codon:yes stop_codon:yes gene_type:complete
MPRLVRGHLFFHQHKLEISIMNVLVIISLLLISQIATAQVVKSKNWIHKNYAVEGTWSIQKIEDKVYFVLGADFKTRSGPDLKIYLAKDKMKAIGNRDAIDKMGGVYLGSLKSNKGAQLYAIPEGINLSDFKSVLIHCRDYSVVWGGVDLP